MNAIKTPEDPSSGNDFKRVLTNLLILGIALILLNGLITLNTLNDLSLILNLKKSTTLYLLGFVKYYPDNTIMKSIKFHVSLKYANL